jgi:hypothetical protein
MQPSSPSGSPKALPMTFNGTVTNANTSQVSADWLTRRAPGSTVGARADRAYSGNVLLAGGSSGARDGVIVSKSNSLDLAFNLVPRLGYPLEEDNFTLLEMRPQLVVGQGAIIGVFHR